MYFEERIIGPDINLRRTYAADGSMLYESMSIPLPPMFNLSADLADRMKRILAKQEEATKPRRRWWQFGLTTWVAD